MVSENHNISTGNWIFKKYTAASVIEFKDFGFGGNHFTELPAEIGQLQKLQRLWLMDNRLAALPPEIGQLQNLQKLDLRRISSQNCHLRLDNYKTWKKLF
jgi:hypothetical protein